MPELSPGLFTSLRAFLPGNAWPVVPSSNAATMLAIMAQLEYTQWLDVDSLQTMQLQQARLLLAHAHKTVPWYRERLAGLDFAGTAPLTPETWAQIPLLTRADVQSAGDALRSESLPSPQHAPLNKIQTSGSTGMPIVAYGTAITRFFWQAFSLRDHLWHRRDMSKKIVAIRPELGMDDESRVFDNWGNLLAAIYHTGKSAMLNSSLAIEKQAEWLLAQQPAYMISLPTNLKELARYFSAKNLVLDSLIEVRAYGEVADEEVYERVRQVWGVPVHDMYSSQEVGYISLQCNEYGHHHIQSENLLVEILDDQGKRCGPGEIGRVVLTTLHNFGMPLIRYVIGDYAEVGEACPCGRGLPVIKRVLGRERNILRLPDGSSHYPSFPSSCWADIAPIRQIQLVQKSLQHIEARLAMDRELGADEQRRFVEVIRERLRYPFDISISYHDSIARSKGGKFEDFMSELKSP